LNVKALQNFQNYLLNELDSLPRRLESSAAQHWEPQVPSRLCTLQYDTGRVLIPGELRFFTDWWFRKDCELMDWSVVIVCCWCAAQEGPFVAHCWGSKFWRVVYSPEVTGATFPDFCQRSQVCCYDAVSRWRF
jgi:hypothetical protein